MHAAVVLAIATVLCLVPELKMDNHLIRRVVVISSIKCFTVPS